MLKTRNNNKFANTPINHINRLAVNALANEKTTNLSVENGNIPEVEVPECIIASNVFSEKSKVTSLCWSPDSSKVAATSDDGCVKLFKVADSISCLNTHTVHRDVGKEV